MRGGLNALAWLAAIVAASTASFWLGGYATDVYRKMLIWVALALSYNFLFGIAGQIAFSHFAFAGVGAYAVVILAHKLGLPFGAAFLLAVTLCALLAFIVALPSTRLEGFYLALATLAFSQLFIVVISEGGELTGGTGGIANYRLPDVFGHAVSRPWYTVVLVLLWRSRCGSCGGSTDPPSAAPAAPSAITRTPPRRWAWTCGTRRSWRSP